MSAPPSTPLRVLGPYRDGFDAILTPDALALVADLTRAFSRRVEALLARRSERRAAWAAGLLPDFDPDTKPIRDLDWRCDPLPADLQDRRVEITGPVDRRLIINALSSGASTFMADFEDSLSPTWDNVVGGQIHLRDAVRRTITWDDPTTGRHHELGDRPATLMVRPRGWHLVEQHVQVDGRSVPATLLDLGLYLFHNATTLLISGSGPYVYLPKLESHHEAQLCNDVLRFVEDRLELPRGLIKATVLIETLPAAFQMDEILYALRERSAGLNCGRWDYIFSFIKVHRAHPWAVLPDRGQIGMTQPFLRAYTRLAVKTCHRRGVHAIGGMAAQIPIAHDAVANEAAIARVRADKLREVTDGHDGTWVPHPALVPLAREVFDRHMPAANQIDRQRHDRIPASALLAIPTGRRTEAGLRENVRIGVQYLAAWLQGSGCVPLYGLMEDTATAEISRTQIWQWVHHGARLDDGRTVTAALVREILDQELHDLAAVLGPERYDADAFDRAASLFLDVAVREPFVEFLTLPASRYLLSLPE